jgi:hypothetical protein
VLLRMLTWLVLRPPPPGMLPRAPGILERTPGMLLRWLYPAIPSAAAAAAAAAGGSCELSGPPLVLPIAAAQMSLGDASATVSLGDCPAAMSAPAASAGAGNPAPTPCCCCCCCCCWRPGRCCLSAPQAPRASGVGVAALAFERAVSCSSVLATSCWRRAAFKWAPVAVAMPRRMACRPCGSRQVAAGCWHSAMCAEGIVACVQNGSPVCCVTSSVGSAAIRCVCSQQPRILYLVQ